MTFRNEYRFFWVAASLAVFLFTDGLADDGVTAKKMIVVDRVFVKSFQKIDVPALKPGLLEEVLCREGEMVRSGEVLARLQDKQAKLALEQAETQSNIAKHLADNQFDLESAEKKLQQAVQASKQHELELTAAQLEAENLLRTQAAEKSQAVAKNELDRAKQSRASFVDSVSESELDKFRLTFERASLETKQAVFDMQLARLKALAAEEVQKTLQLAIESAKVDIKQAQSRITVAGLNAELKRAELGAAKLNVDQHQLRSKLDGMVVDVYRQPGEWVEPGQSVLRVLRLNRLRAEAFVRMDVVNFELENARADVEVDIGGKPVSFAGKVTFISPEIDPINREVSVWMEFDNEALLVKPGMHGVLKIYPKIISTN